MSEIRRRYFIRLIFRIILFICCLFLCFISPESFNILYGFNFFKKFSLFHILWIIWIIDMIVQIIPLKNKVALGSQKLFAKRYKPIKDKINHEILKKHTISTAKSAYMVFLLWTVLIGVIGALFFCNIIGKTALFIISVFFYVCDLICVLIWCPFRLIMKNKCCTTCRIFNWDHLMMFSPMIFIGGFYCISLIILASLCWLVWEICILIFPERFTDLTNEALRCSQCTDKLCTQYCQKIR